MSLTQERINEIALECFSKYFGTHGRQDKAVITAFNLFLSRLREEQEAVAYIEPVVREHQCIAIVKNACCLDDEVINEWYPLFTIPPAAPDCKGTDIRWVSNGVVFGSPTASDALEYANGRLSDPDEAACVSGDARIERMDNIKSLFVDCKELVEVLEIISNEFISDYGIYVKEIARDAISKYKASMGEKW